MSQSTILQVLPRMVSGGVERGTVDIAEAVVAAGGQALVASEGGTMTVGLSRAKAEHITLPLASKNPLTMWRNVARLEELIRREGVDLVHARSRAPAWSAEAAARHCGVPFVTTFHGTYNFSNELKRRYNAVMTKGDRVIAISEFIAQHLRQNYKVAPERVRVIPRGVDLMKFDPDLVSAERMIQLATAWRLPDGKPIVLLPGRLTRWKGQALLLEALALLSDLEFCCLLVGDDQGRSAFRGELEAKIKSLDLTGKAVLLDHCDDMAAAYKLADVVVSAALEPEAFGRVAGEAQAMGRPVVASEHGGSVEQILPNVTGFFFKPGDAASLAEALRRALTLDNETRGHMRQQAALHIRTHYSKALMCERTLKVYEELLNPS